MTHTELMSSINGTHFMRSTRKRAEKLLLKTLNFSTPLHRLARSEIALKMLYEQHYKLQPKKQKQNVIREHMNKVRG